MNMLKLLRTDSTDPDFQGLTRKLDAELHARYGLQQEEYDRLNAVDRAKALVGYVNEIPVACGCFKLYTSQTAELKRMFVDQDHRQRGYSTLLLNDLEAWCAELGFNTMILETGIRQPEAIGLYQKCGYTAMANFGPYMDNDNSVCMQKNITSSPRINKEYNTMMDTNKAKALFIRDRYAALTGIEIVEAGQGYCKARLAIEDKHKNAADVVQGGAIFTLADLAFAVASNSHGQLALAINVNISFLNAATEGVLYATATEVAEPGRLGAYDVLVTDENNAIIARFNGMVYRKKTQLSQKS